MERSRITAAILALFGGSIGLHKFYLKDIGTGIFYIFLTMFIASAIKFPITFLLGVMDAFKLFTMSESQFDAKYNSGARPQRRRGRRVRRTEPTRTTRTRRQSDVVRERQRSQIDRITSKKRANPFIKSGDEKYKDYDFEGAIMDYKQALEISPENAALHYNMAATHSLLEQKEKSYHHIEKAIEYGFKDKDRILKKDAFAFLRIQSDFDDFKANGFRVTRHKSIKAPKDDLLQDDLLLSQLNKLKDLRTRGLLSEKEFNFEKEKLLKK